jgi:acyl-CoA hydrolase
MAWKTEYKRKVISNEEAAGKVRSGDTVVLGLCLVSDCPHLTDSILACQAETAC